MKTWTRRKLRRHRKRYNKIRRSLLLERFDRWELFSEYERKVLPRYVRIKTRSST